jgi:hypothetical protein
MTLRVCGHGGHRASRHEWLEFLGDAFTVNQEGKEGICIYHSVHWLFVQMYVIETSSKEQMAGTGVRSRDLGADRNRCLYNHARSTAWCTFREDL